MASFLQDYILCIHGNLKKNSKTRLDMMTVSSWTQIGFRNPKFSLAKPLIGIFNHSQVHLFFLRILQLWKLQKVVHKDFLQNLYQETKWCEKPTNQESSNASFSLSCQMKCSWAHPSGCFSFMHVCIWNPGWGSHWRTSEEEEGGNFCG